MTPSEHPDLLTIGEFSRRSNLSIKALRHYDELGLLPPAAIDPTNGYRRYGHDQLRVAAHIKLLRGIDLPLVDVGRFLALVAEDPASASASAMLDDHLVRLEEQQAVRRSLVRHLQITLREDADPVYPIRTTHVPAARVASIERHLTIDEADAFLAEAWDAFHEHLAGVAPTLPFTVLLHGVVDDESDGPMEAIIGWPEGVAVPDGLAVRDEPAHDEARTPVTRAQWDFPAILAAYDAVAASPEVGARPGSPLPCREVYVADPRVVAVDEPVCEVAFPLA